MFIVEKSEVTEAEILDHPRWTNGRSLCTFFSNFKLFHDKFMFTQMELYIAFVICFMEVRIYGG